MSASILHDLLLANNLVAVFRLNDHATKYSNQHSIPPKAYNFIKKETLELVFSCEFCEISKNTSSYRTPQVAAPASLRFFSNK